MPTNRSTSSSNVSRFPAPVPGGGASRHQLPVPAHALPHRTPRELLTMARHGLEEAAEIRAEGMRYATAHLAALRAAAAVLAARAVPAAPGRRSRVTSVWSLLVLVAPELSEWASFFATGASKRSAAEAGIPRVVTPREADDLMRASEQFIAVVEVALGYSYQPRIEGLAS
ncbi:SAV_6107 family HEPN domain-containing protein [Dactylosporangium sp. CA-139066]|uniref:SAV_6107 family HEPN domain-containing protein n=1 Tax=Dactylosporangium sp. CA-139066 TaxID=3239930 RepID=UPI003D911053